MVSGGRGGEGWGCERRREFGTGKDRVEGWGEKVEEERYVEGKWPRGARVRRRNRFPDVRLSNDGARPHHHHHHHHHRKSGNGSRASAGSSENARSCRLARNRPWTTPL